MNELGRYLSDLTRSFTLWMLVFSALIVWVVLSPLFAAARIGPRKFAAWCDLNYMAVLDRVVFRVLVRDRAPWSSVREMRSIEHDIDWNDSA